MPVPQRPAARNFRFTGAGTAGRIMNPWRKACGAGCLLVADAGLGAINAAGLTAFYMREKGIPLKGIILNHFRPGDGLHEDNRKMCEYVTGVKVAACIKDGDRDLELSGDCLKSLYEEVLQ